MADRELKFICSPWSDRMVIAGLENRCERDGQYQANHINSIYFDTLNWAFADEKAASDYLKTKVRIRWYEPMQSADRNRKAVEKLVSKCFLEVKRKIGSTRKKVRLPLNMSPAELQSSLRSPALLADLRKKVTDLAPDLGDTELFPRINVRYLRHRYVDPVTGARIAYDSNILGAAVGPAPAERFTARLQQSVLEVKGKEEDMPVNLRFLNAPYLRKAAFSKYYECYCLLTQYQQ